MDTSRFRAAGAGPPGHRPSGLEPLLFRKKPYLRPLAERVATSTTRLPKRLASSTDYDPVEGDLFGLAGYGSTKTPWRGTVEEHAPRHAEEVTFCVSGGLVLIE